MDITRRDRGAVSILDISGEIDIYNAAEIRVFVDRILNDGRKDLILNLEKVAYIDSTGIGVLLKTHRQMNEIQGSLKLMKITPSVRKVFELTRLMGAFSIFDSEEQALNP